MNQIIRRIDWSLLRKQKAWLADRLPCDEAEGLLSLLDDLQDTAVDEFGVKEEAVFGVEAGDRGE